MNGAAAVGYAAHLRVYQPLAAFPPDERARWAAYVESGDAPSRPVLMAGLQNIPDELSEAFIPAVAAERAEMAYDSWLAEHPDTAVGIRTSTWQVPIPWFVLFESDERRLLLGERSGSGQHGRQSQTGLDRALVYLTAMSRARRLSAKARGIVRGMIGEGAALGVCGVTLAVWGTAAGAGGCSAITRGAG